MKKLIIEYNNERQNSLSGWTYYPEDHALSIPDRLRPLDKRSLGLLNENQKEKRNMTKIDLFCLVHELGHIHYKHSIQSNIVMKIIQECQAWQYGLDCVKSEYKEELLKIAEISLRTYCKWSKNKKEKGKENTCQK